MIEDGTIVPIKKLPKKTKNTAKEKVPPPASSPEPPMAKEGMQARMMRIREQIDRNSAPSRIKEVLERWNIKKGKKRALNDSEINRVRRLFQKFVVALEWDDERREIKVVIQDKTETGKKTG